MTLRQHMERKAGRFVVENRDAQGRLRAVHYYEVKQPSQLGLNVEAYCETLNHGVLAPNAAAILRYLQERWSNVRVEKEVTS